MTYALGVDLGTTFTAAAIARGGRASVVNLGNRRAEIPSVVLVREDGAVLTGEAAERRAVSEPDRVGREFKRRLGDTTPLLLGGATYSAESLTARLLAAVVGDVREREGGEPDTIIVTHPANWGPYKADLLRQALEIAALDDAVLLTEPEAAAISYAHAERLAPGQAVAVYDLGGGTFDAAVLRSSKDGFELLGKPVGIERLGGIDFDAAVLGHVTRILGDELAELDEDDPNVIVAFARLRQECIDARETLSSDTEVDIPVMLPGVSTTIRLTRGELEDMIRPALGDSVAALRRAVENAGVAVDDLHAVLLVGGASRTPLVASMISAELGRPVVVDADPKHAIALGAAHHAATLAAAPAGPDNAVKERASKAAADVDEQAEPTRVEDRAAGAMPGPGGSSSSDDGRSSDDKSRGLLVAASIAAALLLVVGGFAVLNKGDDAPSTSPGPSATASPDTSAFVRTTIDEGSMVAVNRTDPTIGTDDLVPSTDPPEYVAARTLPGLRFAYVDAQNTTNRQYYDFISFTSVLPGQSASEVWANFAPRAWKDISAEVPESFTVMGLDDDASVTGMSWEAADSYCTYALKRLVREVDWELAAVDGLIDVSQNQNWVASPDEYAPVPQGAPVLRGSFGIEDLPLYTRTIGDSPANRLNAAIRCAADDVVQVPRPSGQSLYVREFSAADTEFDWPDFHDSSVPQMAFGYHAPDVFHIEVRDDRRLAVFAGEPGGSGVSVQADVELRLPEPPDGNFRYGLIANAGTEGYLLFTVQPRGGDLHWCVARQSAPTLFTGTRFSVTPSPVDTCDLEGSVPSSAELRNTLAIGLAGNEATFSIDSGQVAALAVPADPAGAFGFVVENHDPSLIAHTHFDNLVVKTI